MSDFVTIDETPTDPPMPVVIRLDEIAAVDTRNGMVSLRSGVQIQFGQRHSIERIRTALAETLVPTGKKIRKSSAQKSAARHVTG